MVPAYRTGVTHITAVQNMVSPGGQLSTMLRCQKKYTYIGCCVNETDRKMKLGAYDLTKLDRRFLGNEYFTYIIEPKKSYGDGFFSRMGTSTPTHRLQNFNLMRNWLSSQFGPSCEIEDYILLRSRYETTANSAIDDGIFNKNWAWQRKGETQRLYLTDEAKAWLILSI